MTKPRKILKAIADGLFPFYPLKTANRKRELRYRVTTALLLWGFIALLIYKYITFTDLFDLLKYLTE